MTCCLSQAAAAEAVSELPSKSAAAAAPAAEGVPAVENGVPADKNGVPAVKNGVPAVKNGVPAVSDGALAGKYGELSVKNGELSVNNGAPAANHGAPSPAHAGPAGAGAGQGLGGLRVVFGTAKKTDPIDGPAYRVVGVRGAVIELAEPVHHLGAASVTVKRLKLIRECEYAYVQHVEVRQTPPLPPPARRGR